MRRLLVVAGALVALAAAVPLVAFGIVPLFVRSTVVEPAPPAPAATPAAGAAAEPTTAPPVLAGELRRLDAVHYGSGRVSIRDQVLRFEAVDIAGAPNMYVYLSEAGDGRPGRFVDLGPLRATNGSFNYQVPAGLDLGSIHSVVVWCRAFSVTVTYAPLLPTTAQEMTDVVVLA